MTQRMHKVGWYCNHEDERRSENTHLERAWKRGKWVDASPGPGRWVEQALAIEKPPCPRAVPLYIKDRSAT